MKTVTEMAREAGLLYHIPFPSDSHVAVALHRFANLVRADEREACAQICEQYADVDTYENGVTLDFHAKLIRERNNT